ncbi:cell adhesion molecule CEACAM6 isoform X2 [Brachyhypopomus gauderio]|uniref:cell adhesion molecule CEACAM6 isoform X2 n=1 Tax=Brachyhypopomus gauderio TaxID=698409 RepID=UPI004042A92D
MNVLLHPAVGVLLTALLPWTTVPQSLVPIQFQISPVQVATGSNAVFTLQTTKDIFSISWVTPNGITLGQWIGSQAELNSVPQYQGRITITATQLTISACKLSDAGNYTVTVIPTAVTGLLTNTRSVPLNVFDAVTQVSLTVPTVAIEGSNATLLCTWATGSNTTVTWSKSNSGLSSDATVNGGSLVLNPASRNDAGIYSCTVSNPVSAQTATATLTVYYGPDTPQVSKTSSGCVGGGDVTVGQTIQLTCTSASMPPALLSWQYGGKPLTTSQPSGGTLSLQVFSTNQSGQYTCMASNSITGGVSQQQLTVTVVGTCLSAGAVAGIVIGCFIALVLIIIAIVLLLRQRNVDRRLRDVIGVQKTNLNNEPPVRPASHNTLVTSGMRGNGNTHNLPIDGQTSAAVWHTGQGNGEMLNRHGTRPPTPPAVLRPAEFQTLPPQTSGTGPRGATCKATRRAQTHEDTPAQQPA